jgi:hypothetical protein
MTFVLTTPAYRIDMGVQPLLPQPSTYVEAGEWQIALIGCEGNHPLD